MNSIWRLLEGWTTYQDYLWFLAVLAWSGVIGAEIRRKPTTEPKPVRWWLIALAVSYITGAMAELVLLAQSILTPYMKFDFVMGAAQAGGTAALIWAAADGARRAGWWRAISIVVLAALAVGRWTYPIEAGTALALAQAIAVLWLFRRRPPAISRVTGLLLSLAPLVATHGPWAYLINHGRRNVDWSHFALLAASTTLGLGSLLATASWRKRIQEVIDETGSSIKLQRDLRRAAATLVAWLAGGVLLAVWYGRQARLAYEQNLLRRLDVAVLALDPNLVAEALGPELQIASIEHRRFANGLPVDVALMPHTVDPIYAKLRLQVARIAERNPDLLRFHVAVWRKGLVIALNPAPPQPSNATAHVVRQVLTADDLQSTTRRTSFLEGPTRGTSSTWGTFLAAKAPLIHPTSGQVLGWLVAEVAATQWAATFTQARLQTMALVGAGVGLWAVAVASRLRREARDAAERKASEAAAADRMKSAFLAKVSHELRTPIQSVLGYSELLQTASLDDRQRGWLAALRSHGGTLLRLVNDLIDLGALQSGAFRFDPVVVNLRAIVEDCVVALAPAAKEKTLQVETHFDEDTPTWVTADGVRLRQVLLNLLNNAVKYTPAGSVSITVRRCQNDVEFVVADTGPGIPVALRPRLFQPFARLDPSAGAGSGLGLALVHGLCRAMGGSVWLDEATTQGATFVARLPLRPSAAPGKPLPAAEAKPELSGMRILVAEDNTLVRELLTTFLGANGAEVLEASDGLAAETIARDHAPDVVLLDIGLPGRDGIEVTEALRKDGTPRLRIIGLSAHANSNDEARARKAGMDEFLTKPVSLARLAKALTQGRETPELAAKVPDARLRAVLAAEFTRETPLVLKEIQDALAARDWPRLRDRAHYLKNSADIIGASALQTACGQIAKIDGSPDPITVGQMVEAIIVAVPQQFFKSTGASNGA